MVVGIERVGAPGAPPLGGVGRVASTYVVVPVPTARVPTGSAGGMVVVVVGGSVDVVVGARAEPA
jgi:hypothetical protein